MNLYISGIGAVNAGLPFENQNTPGSGSPDVSVIRCLEPDYKKYIDPKFSRRLSGIIKMGLYAAQMALAEAEVRVPDGIITGTSLGCLTDTAKFLNSMIEENESLLSPSAFIQSTHNSISSQIAIALGCNGYNSTYTNRGFSFESALIDVMLQVEENSSAGFLAGASDEITGELLNILADPRFAEYSRYNTDGKQKQIFPYGEGAAYFYMTGEQTANSFFKITSVKTFTIEDNGSDLTKMIDAVVLQNGIELNGTDLVLYGGSDPDDALTISEKFSGAGVVLYKKYCGEFMTSSSYALWLSCMILKNGIDKKIIDAGKTSASEKILIINSFENKYVSLVTVENV
jgi:hypothetical protein